MGRLTLIFSFRSLIFAEFSLLIFLGNFARSHCGTPAFGQETSSKRAKIEKFPVNYPVSRESLVETGSYLTAHTTIHINDLGHRLVANSNESVMPARSTPQK